MNAPFQPDMELILADLCIGISGLKRNPAAVIAAAQAQQVAILNRNKPVAYMISPEVWEYLCDLVEDVNLAERAREELENGGEAIPVSMDELLA
jgi:antitoxin StbD